MQPTKCHEKLYWSLKGTNVAVVCSKRASISMLTHELLQCSIQTPSYSSASKLHRSTTHHRIFFFFFCRLCCQQMLVLIEIQFKQKWLGKGRRKRRLNTVKLEEKKWFTISRTSSGLGSCIVTHSSQMGFSVFFFTLVVNFLSCPTRTSQNGSLNPEMFALERSTLDASSFHNAILDTKNYHSSLIKKRKVPLLSMGTKSFALIIFSSKIPCPVTQTATSEKARTLVKHWAPPCCQKQMFVETRKRWLSCGSGWWCWGQVGRGKGLPTTVTMMTTYT